MYAYYYFIVSLNKNNDTQIIRLHVALLTIFEKRPNLFFLFDVQAITRADFNVQLTSYDF